MVSNGSFINYNFAQNVSAMPCKTVVMYVNNKYKNKKIHTIIRILAVKWNFERNCKEQ